MRYFILIISLSTLVLAFIESYLNQIDSNQGKYPIQFHKQVVPLKRKAPLTPYAVWWYINHRDAKYPYIVYKQTICESSLTSSLAIKNHNIMGLRLPLNRPTFAICEQDGYAAYSNWQECIDDYILLQDLFNGHSEDDYYLFLAHYGDSCYVEKLKNAKIPIPTEKLTYK